MIDEKSVILSKEKERGVVTFIPRSLQFGFITMENKKENMFFHSNALINCDIEDLREGNVVEFYVIDHKERQKAISVEVVE